jgi:hypothetical protein
MKAYGNQPKAFVTVEGNHRFTTNNVLLCRIVTGKERNEGWMGNARRRPRL